MAKFERIEENLPGFVGVAHLYKLAEAVPYGEDGAETEYVIASYVEGGIAIGPSTLVTPFHISPLPPQVHGDEVALAVTFLQAPGALLRMHLAFTLGVCR